MTSTMVAVIVGVIITSPLWMPLLIAILFWITWGCWMLMVAIESAAFNIRNFFLKIKKRIRG